MFSSLKNFVKKVVLRLPLLGRGLRLAKGLEAVPKTSQQLVDRVSALSDQMHAQPNLWAPLTEQVWEAQTALAEVMADDLRTALERSQREQIRLLESLHRRLDRIESQLAAEPASTTGWRSASA